MALVFIGLGSNLGSGKKNLQDAWSRLSQLTGVVPLTLSSPYRSEPVGIDSGNWFTNAVGALEVKSTPEELLAEMLAIESVMGRNREKGPDRIIDLDILYYNDLIMRTAFLEIPHPEIGNRMFVLAPLEELAPDHTHPATGKTTAQMRRELVSHYTIKQTSWDEPG